MKPFVLFAGPNYYPGGGWNDFHSAYDTREEAVIVGERLISAEAYSDGAQDWYNVADVIAQTHVANGHRK